MAVFGLEVTNPGQELVLSDLTYFPVYLGKASLASLQQPVLAGDITSGTETGGFSTYTFTYAGQIVPALKLAAGNHGAVYRATQAGSTWTITVSYGNGTTDAQGFRIQSAAEVFVFGFPIALGGDWGMAIYNAAGQLVGDLTRQPLLVRQRATMAQSVSSVTLTNPPTVPGIIGRAVDLQQTGSATGVPEISRILRSGAVFGVSGSTLDRQFERRLLRNEENDPVSFIRQDPLDVWIVELNGLA